MTRTVFCKKYQQTLPALALPPLPGAKGQALYDEVSEQAWNEWIVHQTRLINEKHLSLFDPDTRKYLAGQMDKFFNNEELDAVEGYVPEGKTE